MSYPKVIFSLNKSLDKKVGIEFLGSNYYLGINFAQGILGVHPKLKKLILNYIDEFYRKHNSLLIKTAVRFQKEWEVKAPAFFSSVDTIFHHPWPLGKYKGYISIFDCNPRFLEDKTFQIFYRHQYGPVYITAHELLHFIFFDYIEKKRGDIKRKFNDNELCRLSEIVNEILLDPKYLGKVVIPNKYYRGYPYLEKITNKIKKKLGKTVTIDRIINLITREDLNITN